MTLENFAAEEHSQSNRVAWREKTAENAEAWKEALEGIDKGYAISTVARWLQVEKNCPLSIHTLRHQLKDTHDVKSR
tara:strand:+ start:473 stop:703 length:231 start_codon:yes stop_codon:yes gene_type:complete